MSDVQVLIVGAGPTGMTAAIELRRAGIGVRIVDKSHYLARWSQALVVQARTLEQFQRYGIAQTAVEHGRQLTGGRTYSEGKEIVHFTFDQVPSRYPYLLFLPQSETEAILNEHMEALGTKTERGIELVSLDQQTDGVQARLRHSDGREEELEAKWVIGCDGAHSFVREACGIPFEGRGVALHFFLGDMEVEGADKPTDELLLHLHHGDVIFTAPLTDKLTRVIVAKHAYAGNDLDSRAKDAQLSIGDFQETIDKAGVKIRILRSEWMTPFHVNDRQAERYRKGNIFLAGDASHIHSPVAGQGMNTGIQDAANLCWKIAAIERGSDAPDHLLDSYETERAKVGRALLAKTGTALRLVTSGNPLATGLRDLVAPHVSEINAVQKAISGFISETAIEYRSSPVVVDKGGDGELRAGDRLPDVGLSGGSTLVDHWTSGRPLAVLLDGTEAARLELAASFPNSDLFVMRSEDLDADGRRYFGERPSLFVVRPDGYIGFRGSPDESNFWRAYARQDAL
jgi:2-polyprenyl-6-methoxyphenol hydroxylase-like FAD-dependent oxidoreductase